MVENLPLQLVSSHDNSAQVIPAGHVIVENLCLQLAAFLSNSQQRFLRCTPAGAAALNRWITPLLAI